MPRGKRGLKRHLASIGVKGRVAKKRKSVDEVDSETSSRDVQIVPSSVSEGSGPSVDTASCGVVGGVLNDNTAGCGVLRDDTAGRGVEDGVISDDTAVHGVLSDDTAVCGVPSVELVPSETPSRGVPSNTSRAGPSETPIGKRMPDGPRMSSAQKRLKYFNEDDGKQHPKAPRSTRVVVDFNELQAAINKLRCDTCREPLDLRRTVSTPHILCHNVLSSKLNV